MNILIKMKFWMPAVVALLGIGTAQAAVVIDTTFNGTGFASFGTGTSSNGPLKGSGTFTVGNAANRVLAAIVFTRGQGDAVVSKLTYGGVDFTALPGAVGRSASSGYRVYTEIFYLFNPDTTANTTLEYDISAASTQPRGVGLSLVSLNNVQQTAPTTALIDTDGGDGTSIETTLSSVPAGAMVIGGVVNKDSDLTISALSSQNTVNGLIAGAYTGSSDLRALTGYAAVASAGSADMDWSLSASQDFAAVTAAFTSVPEPGGMLLTLCGISLLLFRRKRGWV